MRVGGVVLYVNQFLFHNSVFYSNIYRKCLYFYANYNIIVLQLQLEKF